MMSAGRSPSFGAATAAACAADDDIRAVDVFFMACQIDRQ
jgi:hypothetical protein